MKILSLDKCKLKKQYLIYDIKISDQNIKRHFENLLITKGEKIEICHKNYGCKAFIVKVLGINYAIEKEICKEIFVYDS